VVTDFACLGELKKHVLKSLSALLPLPANSSKKIWSCWKASAVREKIMTVASVRAFSSGRRHGCAELNLRLPWWHSKPVKTYYMPK
jgi:hypothetical protein